MKNPPHPGDLIRTEIIEAHRLSITEAAATLKVRRATLSDLLAGKAALTPEMALRIEKAFGPDMNHLLHMQHTYDVAKTRRHSRAIAVQRYVPKSAVKNLLPDIPPAVSRVVGEIVIRFGSLERAIFTAMARVQCADEGKSGDGHRYLELVGQYKKIQPLGNLIKKAQENFRGCSFDWFDFDALRKLKDQRNAIHDALVEEADGSLTRQASSDRPHRPLDYAELPQLLRATERAIIHINQGSLNYKKSKTNKASDPDNPQQRKESA